MHYRSSPQNRRDALERLELPAATPGPEPVRASRPAFTIVDPNRTETAPTVPGSSVKKRLYPLLAVPVLLVTSLSAASPAAAGVTSKTITKSFTKKSSFYSSPLSRCVHTKITGEMSAFYVRSTQSYPTPADYQSLQDPRVKDLTMTVRTTRTCAAGSARAKVTKATLHQSYYYWKCSSDPSISVSYPWSVGVSATPTCGNEKVARRTTTYDVRRAKFVQYNSGVRATWDKLSYGETSTKAKSCLHGISDVTIYRANISDSVRRGMGKICIVV